MKQVVYVFVGYYVVTLPAAEDMRTAESFYLAKFESVDAAQQMVEAQNKESDHYFWLDGPEKRLVWKWIAKTFACPQQAMRHFVKLAGKKPPEVGTEELSKLCFELNLFCGSSCQHPHRTCPRRARSSFYQRKRPPRLATAQNF